MRWQWPTEGRVLRAFNPNHPGRKGVAIAGELGQPIRAAGPGKVVYSGSGLIGYGQLIIVKHNERFLSAYGHGRRLLVQEGDEVQAGQLIAEMGTNGTEGPVLHFEIRDNGRPVDPVGFLPKR
jgi:lipoprotein NlpD